MLSAGCNFKLKNNCGSKNTDDYEVQMRIRPGSLSREMSHPSHKGCLHLSFVKMEKKKSLWTFVEEFGTEELHRKDAAEDEKEKEKCHRLK